MHNDAEILTQFFREQCAATKTESETLMQFLQEQCEMAKVEPGRSTRQVYSGPCRTAVHLSEYGAEPGMEVRVSTRQDGQV